MDSAIAVGISPLLGYDWTMLVPITLACDPGTGTLKMSVPPVLLLIYFYSLRKRHCFSLYKNTML